jgi:hypothetical protein
VVPIQGITGRDASVTLDVGTELPVFVIGQECTMDSQQRLRIAIDRQLDVVRATVPADQQAAILALVRAIDRQPHPRDRDPEADLISGQRLANLGGNLALRLCLEAVGGGAAVDRLDDWAQSLLGRSARLAEAELVLTHAETGFMRLVDDGVGAFDAWVATKRAPTGWVERADFDWWANSLAGQLQLERPAATAGDGSDRQFAERTLDAMAYQIGYPPSARIDGATIQQYRDVLSWLIGYAWRAEDRGEGARPTSEGSLATAIASALPIGPVAATHAIAALTLDGDNAAYHAAVPGVAAAPVIRLDDDRLVLSTYGLTTEPLLFLTRELRRRAAEEYHNTAHLREDVFRQELYALFPEKRFVTSSSRIELRRESGNVRTDIDAVVFDRKTGTLGFFELKSQDPFARSAAELTRQRDNLLYANRQVSGVLSWLQRSGGDALLNRVDNRTAKSFRVQKVFPFVLGRYLVHFSDGPEPDRRAAWGTWPQVLRLLDGQPFKPNDANPLAMLFNRLSKDTPLARTPIEAGARQIDLGGTTLTVHPSYAAYQERAR